MVVCKHRNLQATRISLPSREILLLECNKLILLKIAKNSYFRRADPLKCHLLRNSWQVCEINPASIKFIMLAEGDIPIAFLSLVLLLINLLHKVNFFRV